MKATEKAYIAGLIEGEGYIGLKEEKKHYYGQPLIKLYNTNKSMVEYVKAIFNCGSIYQTNTNCKLLNAKPVYSWQTTNVNDTLKVILAIKPYIRFKKEQTKIVLRYCRLTIRYKFQQKQKWRIKLLKRIKELNKKGKE